MTAELEQEIAELLTAITSHVANLETKGSETALLILTHLSRINSTLSAIDRNLALLEMKK